MNINVFTECYLVRLSLLSKNSFQITTTNSLSADYYIYDIKWPIIYRLPAPPHFTILRARDSSHLKCHKYNKLFQELNLNKLLLNYQKLA